MLALLLIYVDSVSVIPSMLKYIARVSVIAIKLKFVARVSAIASFLAMTYETKKIITLDNCFYNISLIV